MAKDDFKILFANKKCSKCLNTWKHLVLFSGVKFKTSFFQQKLCGCIVGRPATPTRVWRRVPHINIAKVTIYISYIDSVTHGYDLCYSSPPSSIIDTMRPHICIASLASYISYSNLY